MKFIFLFIIWAWTEAMGRRCLYSLHLSCIATAKLVLKRSSKTSHWIISGGNMLFICASSLYPSSWTVYLWRWRAMYDWSKHGTLRAQWHSITSKNTWDFSAAAARTPYLSWSCDWHVCFRGPDPSPHLRSFQNHHRSVLKTILGHSFQGCSS